MSTLDLTTSLLCGMCIAENDPGSICDVRAEVLGTSITGYVCAGVSRMMKGVQKDNPTVFDKTFFRPKSVQMVRGIFGRLPRSKQKETVGEFLEIFTSAQDQIILSTLYWLKFASPIVDLFESLVIKENEHVLSALKQRSIFDPLFAAFIRHLKQSPYTKPVPSLAFRMAGMVLNVLCSGDIDGGKRVVAFLNGIWQADVRLFNDFAYDVPVKALMVASRAYSVISSEKTKHEKRLVAMKCLSVLAPIAVKLHGENSECAKPFSHVATELRESLLKGKLSFWKKPSIESEFMKIFKAGVNVGTVEGVSQQ